MAVLDLCYCVDFPLVVAARTTLWLRCESLSLERPDPTCCNYRKAHAETKTQTSQRMNK